MQIMEILRATHHVTHRITNQVSEALVPWILVFWIENEQGIVDYSSEGIYSPTLSIHPDIQSRPTISVEKGVC